MSRPTFAVSYTIVTPESSEDGDHAEAGWVETGATLRDAIREVHKTRTNEVDCCADINVSTMHRPPLWLDRPNAVVVDNGTEFRTGAQESRTLHIPDEVTAASARRIARLATGPKRYRY